MSKVFKADNNTHSASKIDKLRPAQGRTNSGDILKYDLLKGFGKRRLVYPNSQKQQ